MADIALAARHSPIGTQIDMAAGFRPAADAGPAYAGVPGESRTADMAIDRSLRTAVCLSLFTDRRAEPGDVDADEDPRGCWIDATLTKGDRFGSRLWTLRRKTTDQTLRDAEAFGYEALDWLLTQGVASRIEVSAQWHETAHERLLLDTKIFDRDGILFDQIWSVTLGN